MFYHLMISQYSFAGRYGSHRSYHMDNVCIYIYISTKKLDSHNSSDITMCNDHSFIMYTLYNSNIQISYMSKPNINTLFQYSTIITLISIDVIAHRRVLITGQNTQDDPHMGFHRMEDPQSCFSANHLSILDDFGVLPFKKIPLEKVTHIIVGFILI